MFASPSSLLVSSPSGCNPLVGAVADGDPSVGAEMEGYPTVAAELEVGIKKPKKMKSDRDGAPTPEANGPHGDVREQLKMAPTQETDHSLRVRENSRKLRMFFKCSRFRSNVSAVCCWFSNGLPHMYTVRSHFSTGLPVNPFWGYRPCSRRQGSLITLPGVSAGRETDCDDEPSGISAGGSGDGRGACSAGCDTYPDSWRGSGGKHGGAATGRGFGSHAPSGTLVAGHLKTLPRMMNHSGSVQFTAKTAAVRAGGRIAGRIGWHVCPALFELG